MAKHSRPSVNVSVAISWRLRPAKAAWTAPSTDNSSARAGVVSAMATAESMQMGNPPRFGRERSPSFVVRIVSGISGLPLEPGGVRHTARESLGLYP
jgi:hypothetical protein